MCSKVRLPLRNFVGTRKEEEGDCHPWSNSESRIQASREEHTHTK